MSAWTCTTPKHGAPKSRSAADDFSPASTIMVGSMICAGSAGGSPPSGRRKESCSAITPGESGSPGNSPKSGFSNLESQKAAEVYIAPNRTRAIELLSPKRASDVIEAPLVRSALPSPLSAEHVRRRSSLLTEETIKFDEAQRALKVSQPPSGAVSATPSPPKSPASPSPASSEQGGNRFRRKSLVFDATTEVVQDKLKTAFAKRNSMVSDESAMPQLVSCDVTGEYECGYSDTIEIKVQDLEDKKQEHYIVTFVHSSFGECPTKGLVDRMHGTVKWFDCVGRVSSNASRITWGERNEQASFWICMNGWQKKRFVERRAANNAGRGNFESVFERRRRSVEGLKMLFNDESEPDI
eukprot:GEMP01043677.1.p1 GENE.GEMP01043677.1~~GEMP01043677.1.p1  ORF type:complete len:354 (+),score=60.10 GEMP01043677.1:270-1331(+)